MLLRFLTEEDGQALVEYGLLISLIALAIVTAVTLFGRRLDTHYENIGNKMPQN